MVTLVYLYAFLFENFYCILNNVLLHKPENYVELKLFFSKTVISIFKYNLSLMYP